MRQKNLVKVGALAMGAAMIGSVFSVPAFAANSDGTPTKVTDTGAITIDDSSVADADLTGHKYNIYKVMDKYDAGSDGSNNKIYQYKLTDAFKNFTSENFAIDVNNGKITTKKAITIGGTTYKEGTVVDSSKSDTSNTNSALVSVLASELAKFAYTNVSTATATSDGGAVKEGLEQGWYLVTESETNTKDGLVATKPILLNLTTEGDVATMKDSIVTLDKSFTQDGGTELVKEDNFDIGDTINYTIASVLPTYAANVDAASVKFTMTDTMTDGLTPPAASAVVVKIDGTPVTTVTPAINGQVLTIDVPADVVLANQGKSIVVEYPCVLNDKALYNATPDATNNNKVVLDFSNNPLVNKDSKQLEDKTKVYTYAVDFQKIDGAHGTLLEGAKFTLAKGDATITLVKTNAEDVDEYRPAVGDETGITEFTTSGKEVRFIGMDDGTYTLTETEAPSGFSKLSGPLSFTITGTEADNRLTGAATVTSGSEAMKLVDDNNAASDGIITAKAENAAPEVNLQVKNYEGISLPSTGAMTSLIVTGVGAAVIGGGLFFGLRRKKDEDED